jgi:tetratricopeptide (TPR) repeat protein
MTKTAFLQLILRIFCIAACMAGCSKAPVQDRPTDAAELVSRGLLHAEKGDERAAIADYTDALRIQPANAEALYLRGAAYDRQGDRASALADYNEALRYDPNLLPALVARAALLTAMGNRVAAAVDEAAVRRLTPDDQQRPRPQ